MPQLDPAFWPTQLFWLAITFIALYLVIWRIALPRIADVLEARQRKLDDDLKKAAALKDEAAAILAEYEKMRATAQASAHEALQKAQDEMKGEAERQGKARSEEHTSELQSLMRISYAVFRLKKTKNNTTV